MITNHAHARTTPLLREPESKKIGFVAPILKFPSANISKTIYVIYNQCHNIYKIKMKWYKYQLNKMIHLKYPILEIWCCHKHTNPLPPSRLKFDTKMRKVFPNNMAA